MRTTLTLDPDVAEKAKETAHRSGKPFKQVVNEALRAGLEQMQRPLERRPYRTKSGDLGLRSGLSLDNVQELLAQIEGEEAR